VFQNFHGEERDARRCLYVLLCFLYAFCLFHLASTSRLLGGFSILSICLAGSTSQSLFGDDHNALTQNLDEDGMAYVGRGDGGLQNGKRLFKCRVVFVLAWVSLTFLLIDYYPLSFFFEYVVGYIILNS
jgi:hypothetical protein